MSGVMIAGTAPFLNAWVRCDWPAGLPAYPASRMDHRVRCRLGPVLEIPRPRTQRYPGARKHVPRTGRVLYPLEGVSNAE